MMTAFDMRRRFIHRALNALPGVSCVDPAGAFYAFPNITGTGIASKTLEVELLDKAGVATIAGTSFGRHGEGFLRLSYANRSEEHTSELQSLMRISYAVFCLKK